LAPVEAETRGETAAPVAHHGLGRIGDLLRRAWQFFITQSFSSLTRRIVSLNVAGLLALSIGIIFLSQFRAGLIDARIQRPIPRSPSTPTNCSTSSRERATARPRTRSTASTSRSIPSA
jgi:hypothetical protein